jgi:hypothetical protein
MANIAEELEEDIFPQEEDIKGFMVIAHQITRAKRVITPETRSIFIGKERSEVLLAVMAKYMEEGIWYVNLTPVDKKTIIRQLKRRKLVVNTNRFFTQKR